MVIQRESLVDIATQRIKQHIVDNQFQAGDKYLSEKELIDRLQVSRTVIREALISLQSIGLLKIVTGDGVYIADANIDPIKKILEHHSDMNGVKIRELAEIRKVIELGAIRLISEKDILIDLSHLEQLNEAFHQAIIHQEDTRDSDRLFHQYLIKSTDNETFYHFSNIIHEYFTLADFSFSQDQKDLLQSHNEHKQIIEALSNKQMVVAQDIMIKHLQPVLNIAEQIEEVKRSETNSSK